jgi:vacuolar protein sorting-associated protein 45
MLHELLGISNNRVKLKVAPKDTEKKEFVISTQKDEFFKKNQFANFGELATNVKNFIETVASEKAENLNIENIEDM